MCMKDCQREMRSAFLGGFAGQLISGVIWLIAASYKCSVPTRFWYGGVILWEYAHLPPHPGRIAPDGQTCQGQHGKSALGAWYANGLYRPYKFSAGWCGYPLPGELVFPGSDDHRRGTLPAIRYPVRDEDVCDSGRQFWCWREPGLAVYGPDIFSFGGLAYSGHFDNICFYWQTHCFARDDYRRIHRLITTIYIILKTVAVGLVTRPVSNLFVRSAKRSPGA